MVRHDLPADQCHPTVGTLDIETSGFDGATQDLIAIGVGYYKTESESADVSVLTQEEFDGDECELIQAAYDWLNERNPDGVVTFNGAGFDFDFLVDKCDALGLVDRPNLIPSNHVDLLSERKQRLPAEQRWPSLEDCLAAYKIPVSETTWAGSKLTNTRFGEELAPQYTRALKNDDRDALYELEATVREYAETDVEANIALYEHDAGREYTPTYAREAYPKMKIG